MSAKFESSRLTRHHPAIPPFNRNSFLFFSFKPPTHTPIYSQGFVGGGSHVAVNLGRVKPNFFKLLGVTAKCSLYSIFQ